MIKVHLFIYHLLKAGESSDTDEESPNSNGRSHGCKKNPMKLERCTEKQKVNGTLNKTEEIETQKNRKKTRTVFSRHQIFYLESAFDAKRYLSSTERSEIASTLNLTETQVKVWFQNRRNKWKSQLASDRSEYFSRTPPCVTLWRKIFIPAWNFRKPFISTFVLFMNSFFFYQWV